MCSVQGTVVAVLYIFSPPNMDALYDVWTVHHSSNVLTHSFVPSLMGLITHRLD